MRRQGGAKKFIAKSSAIKLAVLREPAERRI
jgi:hypothetical protein